MGVDYRANFGIGYKIIVPKDIRMSDKYSDLDDYLSGIIGERDFSYFEVGEGAYTGEENDLYIVTDEYIDENTELCQIKSELTSLLLNNNIIIDSDFGLFGGLYIY